jgi:maltose/moltooligosaccharide transporter
MCFGFFGIQIGFGLQNANTSRIFQTLGVEVNHLAILWIAAPATGLLVQPIIGYLSDKTWGRLGRRRPYFFWGAILTTLALLVMPNAPALWVAAGALWVMDASINITMEPFRAFVGDNLPDEQRATRLRHAELLHRPGRGPGLGLAVDPDQLVPCRTPPRRPDPDAVRIAFYAGGGGPAVGGAVDGVHDQGIQPRTAGGLRDRASSTTASTKTPSLRSTPISASACGTAGRLGPGPRRLDHSAGEGALRPGRPAGRVRRGGHRRRAASSVMADRTANGFSEVLEDLFRMPKTMRQLAVVQFFSWFGLFAMWIYTTPAVAAVHFHAVDATSKAYNDGADWVGVLFAVYNGVAALAALVIPLMVRSPAARQPRPVPGPGRPGPGVVPADPRAGPAVDRHDRRRLRLELDPVGPVLDPGRSPAGPEDGRLHGHLQFLHRHPAAAGGDGAGPAAEELLRRRGDLGPGAGRGVVRWSPPRRPSGFVDVGDPRRRANFA